MKKIIAIVFAVIMLFTAAFAGPVFAEGEDDLTGVWNIQSMEQGGMKMEGALLSLMGMEVTLTLNEDGTAALTMNGESKEGTWTVDGVEGILDFGEAQLPFTVGEGTLSIEQDGMTMNMSRDDAGNADAELAPAVTDPKLADFNGTWNAVSYVALGIPIPLETMGANITLIIEDGKIAVSGLFTGTGEGEEAEAEEAAEAEEETAQTLDVVFDAELKEDGVLYLDFAGSDILGQIGMEASGINLTLHEDGRMSGRIPEVTEALSSLSTLTEETGDAEAEGTGDSSADSEGGSSGSESMDMYLILEKAE